MDDFWKKVVAGHEASVRRGEHDEQCEFQVEGFFLCDCRRRARLARGQTELPTEELEFPPPDCSRCGFELGFDGDSWCCYECHLKWDSDGRHPRFDDDRGDVAASLADWKRRRSGQPSA